MTPDDEINQRAIKIIEILAKYTTEELEGYEAKIAFHLATDGEVLDTDKYDLDEFRKHQEIVQKELHRRALKE